MHKRSARRLAALLVTAALGLIAAAGLTACGEEDPAALLDRAFKQPIESANVAADLSVQAKGVPQLEQPARFQLRGPYRSGGKDKIPSLDFDLSLSAQGQTFTAGITSTGDNAYVSFRGQNYEFGEQEVAKVNKQIADSAGKSEDRSLKDLGINPRSWIKDAQIEGDEQIAGTETTHVTAGLDVARVLEDLNRVSERTGGQLGGQSRTLTPEQREQIRQVLRDPKLDVYVGKDDEKIRRLSTNLRFEIPENRRQQANGAESGTVSFSIEFADVGGDQKITAPANARPIQDLAEQVRGLLGGGGAAPGGGAGGGAAPGAGGGAAPGAGGGADQEKLQRVRECLAQAGNDRQAQERCAAML